MKSRVAIRHPEGENQVKRASIDGHDSHRSSSGGGFDGSACFGVCCRRRRAAARRGNRAACQAAGARERLGRSRGEDPALGACAHGDHHLRYVEPALVPGATRRVGELAPAMNRAVAAARAKGVLIIHAPSSCMGPYADHPARKRARNRLRRPRSHLLISANGAIESRPRRRAPIRSTRTTAAATTDRRVRPRLHGDRKSRPSRSAIRT